MMSLTQDGSSCITQFAPVYLRMEEVAAHHQSYLYRREVHTQVMEPFKKDKIFIADITTDVY